MPSMNKAVLIGHLGQDPETRTTQSGKTVCNFTMATSNKEHTEWHRIACWNRLAELCAENLSKGDLVYVEGPIQSNKWTDREGNQRENKQIVAHVVYFLRTKKDRRPAPEKETQSDFGYGPDDDDVSF